jgi:periplasmic protein TonB
MMGLYAARLFKLQTNRRKFSSTVTLMSSFRTAIVNDEESIVMTYSTGTAQERMVRMTAVTLLHVGLGAALLTMGGYEVIKNAIEPSKVKFIKDTPPPPLPKAKPPETIIDDNVVKIPKVKYTVDKPVEKNDTIIKAVITKGDETAGSTITPPVTPVKPDADPVKPEPVRYAAKFDPRYDNMIQPNYPGMARSVGAEGAVELMVTIGTDGRVMSVTLLKSSGNDELDNAALKHAKKYWRFKPATEDGKPVISTLRRRILFKLDIQRG